MSGCAGRAFWDSSGDKMGAQAAWALTLPSEHVTLLMQSLVSESFVFVNALKWKHVAQKMNRNLKPTQKWARALHEFQHLASGKSWPFCVTSHSAFLAGTLWARQSCMKIWCIQFLLCVATSKPFCTLGEGKQRLIASGEGLFLPIRGPMEMLPYFPYIFQNN